MASDNVGPLAEQTGVCVYRSEPMRVACILARTCGGEVCQRSDG